MINDYPVPLTYNSVAGTNATVLRSMACFLFSGVVSNTSASPVYVKFYDKATAPTVGTDVPVFVLPVAANANVPLQISDPGLRFKLGISIAITGGSADTDTTAIAANVVKLMASSSPF